MGPRLPQDAVPPDSVPVLDQVLRCASGVDPSFEPVVAVARGSAIESIHRAAMAIVDSHGELAGGIGDPRAAVLLRSAAKPFQALAVIESGAADAFSMSEEELAVMCGSHAGEAKHIQTVTGLLDRLRVSPTALVCGSAAHMCSGKHAGMLALALHLGAPIEGYERAAHPVQQEIARIIRELVRRRPDELEWGLELRESGARSGDDSATGPIFAGVDGCGVPVVRLSLSDASWLYAALAAGLTPELARVRDAMLAHPDLVAGDTRLDTRVMRAAAGRVVAKGGAEGVQGLALLRGLGSDGTEVGALGCVAKVEDGSHRPVPALVALCLRAQSLQGAASEVERESSPPVQGSPDGGTPRQVILVRPEDLCGPTWAAQHEALRLDLGAMKLTVCRGDEKEVHRFLREEWPAADQETFGRAVDWIAEPIALVLRRKRSVVGVLKGHFVGGVGSVDELLVARGQRGMGIGSWLLERFEAEAQRRGIGRIILRAVKGSRAEQFYRHRGYYRECVQYSYEYGYDYVRMTRELRENR